MSGNEAVSVAKARNENNSDARVLSTGYRARILPVGASYITEAQARVKDPPVPIIFDEDKGREIENPTHPDYLAALADARIRRGVVAMDAMVMFGIELIDGIPDDDTWLKKLRLSERLGHIDLSEFDLEDEIDLEFLFKRYVAVGTEDLIEVGKKAGLQKTDVDNAIESFRGSP